MKITVDEELPELQYLEGLATMYQGEWEDLDFSLHRSGDCYVITMNVERRRVFVKFRIMATPPINIPEDLDTLIHISRLPSFLREHVWENVFGGDEREASVVQIQIDPSCPSEFYEYPAQGIRIGTGNYVDRIFPDVLRGDIVVIRAVVLKHREDYKNWVIDTLFPLWLKSLK